MTAAAAFANSYTRERQRLRAERVVLVDQNDREVGVVSKLRAHRERRLHRAVSVMLLDSRGTFLLQRRAAHKYHSAGLWSNTCCGHPRPGENALACARRRLREEMGIVCPLTHAFSFTYDAALGDGMWEHELDHVFIGITDNTPRPDASEVSEWQRVSPQQLRVALTDTPNTFTIWFRVLMEHAVIRQAESAYRSTPTQEGIRVYSGQ